jgi:hypothetical protein
MKNIYSITGIICFIAIALSCKKENEVNPYATLPAVSNNQPDLEELEPGNFAWLHAKIFQPTCANSGCHDGTFEPEFRSISSSYNTLVNHPVISNDLQNSYQYRVVPGNLQASLLNTRLLEALPNSSGIMPLSLSQGSDWPQMSNEYIQRIQEWILGGAKDMFGNPAPSAGADFPPQVMGLLAFPAGNISNPYQRVDGEALSPIQIDAANVDLWVYWTDDQTPAEELSATIIKWSESSSDFEFASTSNMNISGPLSGPDFSNNTVQYLHKATIDFSGLSPGETFFIRCYASDGEQEQTTEVPNNGSSDLVTAIFVLQIQ